MKRSGAIAGAFAVDIEHLFAGTTTSSAWGLSSTDDGDL